MMPTKIISRFLIVIAICSFFVSCKSQQDEDEAETKDCIEGKTETEKYKSVEEAIANYDFLTARKYLSCYPNTYYDNYNGKRTSSDRGDKNTNKYVEKLTLIVKAEIAYMLINGEFSKAQNVAAESGLNNEYQKAIPTVINTLMDKRDYDKIFNILTTWTFETSFNPDASPNYDANKNYNIESPSNLKYNEESHKYNDIIDNVLKAAIINEDKKTATKCLPLYVPVAITNPEIGAENQREQKSILKNEARIAAKQKMAEAGM